MHNSEVVGQAVSHNSCPFVRSHTRGIGPSSGHYVLAGLVKAAFVVLGELVTDLRPVDRRLQCVVGDVGRFVKSVDE